MKIAWRGGQGIGRQMAEKGECFFPLIHRVYLSAPFLPVLGTFQKWSHLIHSLSLRDEEIRCKRLIEREEKRNLDKVTTNKWESRIPSECTAMWLSKPVTLCVDYCLHFKVFPSSALEGRGWGCVLPCGPMCPSSHLESPLLGAGYFLLLLFPIHCSLLRTVSFTAAMALVLLLMLIVAGLLLLLFPSKSFSVQQPEWSLKMFIISSWPQNKIQKPYQWASMALLWPLLPPALRSTPWTFCSSHTDFLSVSHHSELCFILEP